MTNKRSIFERYEIVPVRLDSSRDALYDFMILQFGSYMNKSEKFGKDI